MGLTTSEMMILTDLRSTEIVVTNQSQKIDFTTLEIMALAVPRSIEIIASNR
jgi:hypothetical protein